MIAASTWRATGNNQCKAGWLMLKIETNPTTCAMKSLHSLRLFVDFGDFFLFDATIRGIMATENSK